jgi:hypothetical protein
MSKGELAQAEDVALWVEDNAALTEVEIRNRINHPVDTREPGSKLVGPRFVVAVEPMDLCAEGEDRFDNCAVAFLVDFLEPLSLNLLRLSVDLVAAHRAHVEDIAHHENHVGLVVFCKAKHCIERADIMHRLLHQLPLWRHLLVIPEMNITERYELFDHSFPPRRDRTRRLP